MSAIKMDLNKITQRSYCQGKRAVFHNKIERMVVELWVEEALNFNPSLAEIVHWLRNPVRLIRWNSTESNQSDMKNAKNRWAMCKQKSMNHLRYKLAPKIKALTNRWTTLQREDEKEVQHFQMIQRCEERNTSWIMKSLHLSKKRFWRLPKIN